VLVHCPAPGPSPAMANLLSPNHGHSHSPVTSAWQGVIEITLNRELAQAAPELNHPKFAVWELSLTRCKSYKFKGPVGMA
jgi:hypothetical protein